MSPHLKQMLRALAAVVVIVAAPYFVGRHVLHEHAVRTGLAEQTGLATQQLTRIERVFGDALAALRTLEREERRSCLSADRQAFARLAASLPFVRRIGLVDQGGAPLCLEPVVETAAGLRLPARRDGDPRVTIALRSEVGGGQGDQRLLLLAWGGSGGLRYVAELFAEALENGAGAEYLRGQRSSEVIIDGRRLFAAPAPADTTDLSVVKMRSSIFPVEVVVTVPYAVFEKIFQPLEMILLVGVIAVGLVLCAVIVVLYWRPPGAAAENEFALAVVRGDFVPYYQPVVNIVTGRLEGCEALVRWRRRDGTIITPGQFMQYAEASGDVFPITRHLMAKVAEELAPLYGEQPHLKVSINLFAGHFDDGTIVEDVRRTFTDAGFDFGQLVFEVTERLPLRNVDAARCIMEELKALGCRIALDDTGAGHSGLATIQQLPFDVIKIDKMFIDAMDLDENASRIVDVLVGLAKSFGLGLVAEGVEREEQVHRLRHMGVTAAQGYFFAPPLPGKAFIDLARALAGKAVAPVAEEVGAARVDAAA